MPGLPGVAQVPTSNGSAGLGQGVFRSMPGCLVSCMTKRLCGQPAWALAPARRRPSWPITPTQAGNISRCYHWRAWHSITVRTSCYFRCCFLIPLVCRLWQPLRAPSHSQRMLSACSASWRLHVGFLPCYFIGSSCIVPNPQTPNPSVNRALRIKPRKAGYLRR